MTRSTSAARNLSPAALASSLVVMMPPSIASTVAGKVCRNAAYCASNSGTRLGNWGRYAPRATAKTPTRAVGTVSILLYLLLHLKFQVADGGRLDGQGDHPLAGGLCGQLVQQLVLGPAPGDVELVPPAAGQFFQLAHRLAVARGQRAVNAQDQVGVAGGGCALFRQRCGDLGLHVGRSREACLVHVKRALVAAGAGQVHHL